MLPDERLRELVQRLQRVAIDLMQRGGAVEGRLRVCGEFVAKRNEEGTITSCVTAGGTAALAVLMIERNVTNYPTPTETTTVAILCVCVCVCVLT
jgi:hypothetical protein